MQVASTRRRFLKAGVVGGLGSASLLAGASSAAIAETVTLSGTVTAETGGEIRNDEITVSGSGDARTDGDGNFEVEVMPNAEYNVGFYKADARSDLEPTKNGVPHIYHLGEYYVGSDGRDLGELVLPEPHVIDLRILDANGEPLMGAQPDFWHDGWGANNGRLAVDSNGYTFIQGAPFTGFELANRATLAVKPPRGGDYQNATYRRKLTVDEPTEVVATIDSSGVRWEVNQGDESPNPTETATAPETTARTSTTTETTTGPESTRTTTESASTPRTETTSTPRTETTSTADATPTATAHAETGTDESPERGFFSNDADAEDLEMLNDPFVLTVGGFVLSAAGIAHQMLRGY